MTGLLDMEFSLDKIRSKIKESIVPVPTVYQQQLVEVSASDNLK